MTVPTVVVWGKATPVESWIDNEGCVVDGGGIGADGGAGAADGGGAEAGCLFEALALASAGDGEGDDGGVGSEELGWTTETPVFDAGLGGDSSSQPVSPRTTDDRRTVQRQRRMNDLQEKECPIESSKFPNGRVKGSRKVISSHRVRKDRVTDEPCRRGWAKLG